MDGEARKKRTITERGRSYGRFCLHGGCRTRNGCAPMSTTRPPRTAAVKREKSEYLVELSRDKDWGAGAARGGAVHQVSQLPKGESQRAIKIHSTEENQRQLRQEQRTKKRTAGPDRRQHSGALRANTNIYALRWRLLLSETALRSEWWRVRRAAFASVRAASPATCAPAGCTVPAAPLRTSEKMSRFAFST